MKFDEVFTAIREISETTRRESMKLQPHERSIFIGLVASAFRIEMTSLAGFKKKLEDEGKATPPTEEQLKEIDVLFKMALAKEKPTN